MWGGQSCPPPLGLRLRLGLELGLELGLKLGLKLKLLSSPLLGSMSKDFLTMPKQLQRQKQSATPTPKATDKSVRPTLTTLRVPIL